LYEALFVTRIAIGLTLLFAFGIPHAAGQNTQQHQAPVVIPSLSGQPVPARRAEPEFDRPVSWKQLFPNIVSDQKRIWLFPLKLGQANNATPTVSVLAATAGLVALDPFNAAYFRRTTTFDGFNRVFTSNATAAGTVVAPISFYLIGLVRKDSKMQKTALLAGEAVADAEIVTTVLKDIDKRVRPVAVARQGNFSDTWFDSKGSVLRGNGSFPSGHSIAAFSVATVIARRDGKQHRWVPYAAYGMASLVGFSRVSLSAHFVSDVFMGAALGYSISRFAVLRQ
jgi:membrane-associated phospholipid phosphatase